MVKELGRVHPNGQLIKDGYLGSNEEFLDEPYLVDEKTGEGHYKSEWVDIINRLKEEALQKLGHPAKETTYGPWLEYFHGQCLWMGLVA